MLARLDGNLIKRLHAAILDAFSASELKQFVRTSLDARLEEISLNAEGLSEVVSALISWAERRFRIPDLLDGLLQERPGNPIFEHLHGELNDLLKGGGRGGGRGWSVDGAPPAGLGQDPQGVEPAAVVRWAQELYLATRSVCLIEFGDLVFTGFAIGPRLVLTVRHPMAEAIDEPRLHDVRVRFGWASAVPDDTAQLSLWELDPGMGVLDQDVDLDFALLLLGAPAEPQGTGMLVEQFEALRDSLATVEPARLGGRAAEGEPLYLLGHPLGGMMQVETLSARESDDPTRVSYAMGGQRRGGRSGAPIFDKDWRVVGMHREWTSPGADGLSNGAGVALAPILERPVVQVARAVSRPPPERALEQMAI